MSCWLCNPPSTGGTADGEISPPPPPARSSCRHAAWTTRAAMQGSMAIKSCSSETENGDNGMMDTFFLPVLSLFTHEMHQRPSKKLLLLLHSGQLISYLVHTF